MQISGKEFTPLRELSAILFPHLVLFTSFQGLFEKFLKLFASQMVKIEKKKVYLL